MRNKQSKRKLNEAERRVLSFVQGKKTISCQSFTASDVCFWQTVPVQGFCSTAVDFLNSVDFWLTLPRFRCTLWDFGGSRRDFVDSRGDFVDSLGDFGGTRRDFVDSFGDFADSLGKSSATCITSILIPITIYTLSVVKPD